MVNRLVVGAHHCNLHAALYTALRDHAAARAGARSCRLARIVHTAVDEACDPLVSSERLLPRMDRRAEHLHGLHKAWWRASGASQPRNSGADRLHGLVRTD